jgi:DNA-binding Lrp family transcriptional regulator
MVTMDDTDTTLIQLLEENSRIPTVELGAMLNLPPAEVEERIRALQATGVIRRFTAIVDRAGTDHEGVAAILELKVSPERDHGYDRIAERIARFDEVRAVQLITGTYDLNVLVTGKDMQEVARFVSEHIAPMERIRETATHIIMKSYKENGTLLLSHDAGGERQPFSF